MSSQFNALHTLRHFQSAQLSLMHPRLLHTLVLLDPTIQTQPTTVQSENKVVIAPTTQLSTYRRDLWPSRKAAWESYKRNPFYQSWDPRVLERWVEYGLRDLPTAIYPQGESNLGKATNSDEDRPVTLTTTRHQEVFTYSRPNYDGPPGKDVPLNRTTHPDLNLNYPGMYPFYRPEPAQIFTQMPLLRPSVLYIFGGKSYLSLPEMISQKLANTGVGVGGSGGVDAGRVRHVRLAEVGHLVAQEAPVECAEAAAGWLGSEIQRWRDDEEAFRTEWSRKSKIQKFTVDERWLEHVPRPQRNGTAPAAEDSKSKL